MLKKIVIALLVIVVLICGLAMMKPDSFVVTRSIAIKAPPEKVFVLINDFHNWSHWSPWEHLDPNMKRTFSGAAAGKGAVYGWEGNSDVGAGRMEITDEAMPTKVEVKLEFLKPVAMTNQTEFALTSSGDTTTVTWNMRGPMPFITKLMSVFTSMDAMVGKDFEKGLANMKASAEK
jgi:uncharacterized protein YndB with AHSA1/START domain